MLTIAALFVALRFVWLPLHLAHEHQDHGFGGDEPHALGRTAIHEHEGAPHDHANELRAHVGEPHEHEGEPHEHERHTSADHASDLIARKTAHVTEFVWLPLTAGVALDVAPHLACIDPVRSGPAPRPRPPRASLARGPPAA